jgi:hypothetical protein
MYPGKGTPEVHLVRLLVVLTYTHIRAVGVQVQQVVMLTQIQAPVQVVLVLHRLLQVHQLTMAAAVEAVVLIMPILVVLVASVVVVVVLLLGYTVGGKPGLRILAEVAVALLVQLTLLVQAEPVALE